MQAQSSMVAIAIALCQSEEAEQVAVHIVVVDHAHKIPGGGNLINDLA